MNVTVTRGEGANKSENFADVIYGRPQTNVFLLQVLPSRALRRTAKVLLGTVGNLELWADTGGKVHS